SSVQASGGAATSASRGLTSVALTTVALARDRILHSPPLTRTNLPTSSGRHPALSRVRLIVLPAGSLALGVSVAMGEPSSTQLPASISANGNGCSMLTVTVSGSV